MNCPISVISSAGIHTHDLLFTIMTAIDVVQQFKFHESSYFSSLCHGFVCSL